MRAALLGALSAGGFPPVPVTAASATVPIPLGAATVDIYTVTSGVDGLPAQGGNGGSCLWVTNVSVLTHTTIVCQVSSKGAYTVITWEDSTAIAYAFGNTGGVGGMGGGGGGPASELGPGMDGAAGELGQGGSIAATGSVLVDYLGSGGRGGSKFVPAENGVAWGGGGGAGGTAAGAPGGTLLIFK